MKKLISWCLDIYKKNKEVFNYLIFGVLATLINIGVFAVFNYFLGKNLYQLSNVIAILAAVFFQYFTNRFFVFERKEQTKKEVWIEFIKFMAARAITSLMDVGIMYVGISLLLINELVMKVFTNIIVIILNYVFSKFLVFTKKKDANDLKSENV